MHYPPKWLQPAGSHPSTAIFLAAFVGLYLAAVVWLSQVAWRDPTSVFFRPDKAHEPGYSTARMGQSERFLANISQSGFPPSRTTTLQQNPEICIGIPTVARKGVRYLRIALASLLDGLTEEERSRMHLIVFIADLKPEEHPAYHEPWLFALADEVLTHQLSPSELEDALLLDDQHKGVYDFRTLLSACVQLGTPYTSIFEDDVLAAEGWFGRTMDGLAEAESKTAIAQSRNDWLYLRLFFTEEFLGWNSESAPQRAFLSLLLIVCVGVVLFSTRLVWPRTRPYLTNTLILAVCCFCMPLLIALFFLAGRMTLMPLPVGVNRMNKYGCCSQGLVFNQAHAGELVEWLGHSNSGLYFDMLVEKFADEHDLERWALQPPVLQHVGIKSSSDGELKSKRAKQVWSFAFESYDVHGLGGERHVDLRT